MTITYILLVALFLLFTKHFIVDFPLQGPFQYKNKGTYGHAGGILHSALHALPTFAIFVSISFWMDSYDKWFIPFYLALLDFILHYHIDWAKMSLNRKLGLGPTTHEQFWWLLGVDQYLHALTYFGLVFIFFKDFI